MLVVVVISVIVGAVLGTRYRVLCLLPTALVGIGALAAIARLSDTSAATVGSAVALVVALQAGYVAGLALGRAGDADPAASPGGVDRAEPANP